MKVSSVDVTDMIGRNVMNENGAEFRIIAIRYDVQKDRFVAWIAAVDLDTGTASGEEEAGLTSLRGWTLL